MVIAVVISMVKGVNPHVISVTFPVKTVIKAVTSVILVK